MKKNEVLKTHFRDFAENSLIEWLGDCFDEETKVEEIEETLLSVKELCKECNVELVDKFVIYESDYGDDEKYYGVDYRYAWEGSPIGTLIKEV